MGDSCEVKTTGVRGVCRISSNCPIVEEQAQNGISPTICGYYQLTVPIVCCEENAFVQPNDDTLLNREPDREPNYSNNRRPNPSYNREPSTSNNREPNPSYNKEPSTSNNREPNPSYNREPNPSYNREPSTSNNREPNPSYNREPNPSYNREPNPNIFPEANPDAVVYPDSDNQPVRPQVTHTSKSEQSVSIFTWNITYSCKCLFRMSGIQ